MSSYPSSNDSIAFIVEGDSLSKSELASKLRAGSRSWSDIEADIFTYRGKTLVLARQLPPTLHRVGAGCIRLNRR